MVTPMTDAEPLGVTAWRAPWPWASARPARRRPTGAGRLGLDLGRRLVLAQALEGGLAHHAVAGEAGELDLGHQLRLRPSGCRPPSRGAPWPGERALVGLQPLQPRQHAARPCRGRSRCRPGRRRPACRRGGRRPAASGSWPASPVQPPITTSWPARHLAFAQVVAAAGPVGRVEPLGDDALQRPCGRPTAAPRRRRSRMVDVADALAGLARPRAGPSAAPCARAAAGRAGPRPRRTAGRRRRRPGRSVLPSDSAACRAGEVGRAVVRPARTASPSMMPSGRLAPALRDLRELRRPVEALAGPQRRLAALDAQLHAVAVELDLVGPARPGGGRSTAWPAAARRSPAGPAALSFGAGGRALRRPCGAASAASPRLRLPDRARPRRAPCRS